MISRAGAFPPFAFVHEKFTDSCEKPLTSKGGCGIISLAFVSKDSRRLQNGSPAEEGIAEKCFCFLLSFCLCGERAFLMRCNNSQRGEIINAK